MTTKPKNTGNSSKQKQVKQSADTVKGSVAVNKDMLDYIDAFFTKRTKFFLFLGLGLTVLFSFLLFDLKVGPGGDDSAYIARAYDFVHEFKYPGYQGALYPLVLSFFVWIFGISLPMLKILSLIFTVVAMYFFYKAFSNGKIPQTITTLSFILLSINYYMLYFSSQTYSEAFFLMLQAIFFWFMSSRFVNENTEEQPLKNYILLGLLLFLLSLTKNIAYAVFPAVVMYFIFCRQWKNAGYTIGSFLAFFAPFEIIKRLIWGGSKLQFSSQGSGLMYKDFYNPSAGKEDFWGFINRFFDNSNQYFSKHLFNFLGLRLDTAEETIPVNPIFTIFIWGILLISLYLLIRKNKLMLLASIYTITLCAATFLALQASWNQWRIIIIAFPLILLLFFSVIYYTTKTSRLKTFQFILPLLVIVFFFSSFSVTKDYTKLTKANFARNLSGDALYGWTPDWRNYIQMSIWAARNTSKEELTAVRKADISFIYGQRKFFGITKVPSIMPDSLLKLMPDTKIYIGVDIEKVVNTAIYAEPLFRGRLLSIIGGIFSFGGDTIIENGKYIGIYGLTKEEFTVLEPKLKQSQIFYDIDIKAWIKNISRIAKEYSIYLPDYMFKQLKDNNVRYMLLASLRMNPNENTGQIINTLQRYLEFIRIKYPNNFKVVHTIGTDEVAQLVEINYQGME